MKQPVRIFLDVRPKIIAWWTSFCFLPWIWRGWLPRYTLFSPLAEPDSCHQLKQYCGTARELNLALQFTIYRLYLCWLKRKNTRSSFRLIIRYALRKKLRYYLGIFPKWGTPPLLGTPYSKKNLSFILHFRPLGTFLVFTKKLKFCHFCYIYFWE